MATTIGFWFPAQSGNGLTAELWTRTSPPTLANGTGGDAAAEPDDVNKPGYFEFEVAEEIDAGLYDVRVFKAGNYLDSEGVMCDGTEGPFVTLNYEANLDAKVSSRLKPTVPARTLNVGEDGSVAAVVSDESIRDAVGLEEGKRVATPEDVLVSVTPNTANGVFRGIGTNLCIFVGETKPIPVYGVKDANKQPRDLTAIADKRVIVEDNEQNEAQEVPNSGITVSGSDNNDFSWEPSEGVYGTKRTLYWALCEFRDDKVYEVIVNGELNVGTLACQECG